MLPCCNCFKLRQSLHGAFASYSQVMQVPTCSLLLLLLLRYYKDQDGLSLDVGPFTAALVSSNSSSRH